MNRWVTAVDRAFDKVEQEKLEKSKTTMNEKKVRFQIDVRMNSKASQDAQVFMSAEDVLHRL